jgi:CheY-like chemotaxis protein
MEEHQAVSAPPVPSARPRVLVVDDDPAIRLICATWLSLDGYEVLEAANGQDALDLAFNAKPAVVLLDLSMPVLDGFGVAAALRADERTRELPLVVLTGETGPRVTRRVFEMGAAGFFTKPFDPGAVAAFVRNVVGEIASGQEPSPAGGHAF